MEFKDLGISNSLLWFLISIFLVFWIGDQLIGAVTNLEILNIRTTDLVSFNKRPIWFSFIAIFKALVWVLSVLIAYKYVQTKFTTKNT